MQKIYGYQDEADCAYLLKSGAVYFDIKEKELYKISGKNLIIAAGELILNYNSDAYCYRAYNFYKDENAELAQISPENLKRLALNYGVGFNMNIFFAQMIRMTNKILAKRQSAISGDVKTVHDISGIYYEITNSLLDIAKKTKFPDIIQLGEKLKNELIYETGRIFSQQKSPVKMQMGKKDSDAFNISFAPESVICNEGEQGNEMYILNHGRIGVLINGNKVAEIDQPGTVIGEIALLLGETRTATLKANDQVELSVIKKDNLQAFHKSREKFFLEIGETLSKRINNNFEIINDIDKRSGEKPDQKVAGFLTKDRAEKYLIQIEKDICELYRKKEYEQLIDTIKKAKDAKEKYI
ncbi:MAG: cyclic nucleotide-binding domain-containing protein [Spirochaetota bacterium]